MGYWTGKNVVVTGGASFIGSHLCEALLDRGAGYVSALDDLSSGKKENLDNCLTHPKFMFIEGNLFEHRIRYLLNRHDVLFHLAAEHGGRGYVDQQQCLCSTNLALDNLVFMDAVKYGIKQIVFASSGCVYPMFLQRDPTSSTLLHEFMVPPYHSSERGYDADQLYGWAKLMAEFTLQAIYRERGIKTCSTRYFTAYGPRAKEDHAVMAMIGRAFVKQNPFEIWGDGTAVRNWTYISDIVEGTLLAAENLHNGTAVNVGTTERTTVLEAASKICQWMGHHVDFKFLMDKPVGPMNRVAGDTFCKAATGWSPSVTFEQGVKRTIEWYVATKNQNDVRKVFMDGLVDGNRR